MRSSPTAPVLRLSAVSARSGVRELSFEVAAGEILTLLGENAAAILRIVAGYERRGQGTISVGGRTMDRTPPHRRKIGMVSAQTALFPHLDVLAHAGFAPGVSADRAAEVLERLGLLPLARVLPITLSAEERFRVALARALAPKPPLILLDDPLAPLPGAHRTEGQALLRALSAENGIALLHATSDPNLALGLSDRIGVIAHGRLAQLGPPGELYNAPASLAVATSLGAVNRLEGRLVDSQDGIGRIRLHGGVVVEAQLHEALAPGASCVVVIRPEQIAVASVPASEMGDGAVPARLIETLHLGASLRLRCAVATLVGADSGAELIVLRPSGIAPPRGNTLSLAWQPHHARAFGVST